MRKNIRIGLVGVGNCTASLIMGIEYYKRGDLQDYNGLMHFNIADYRPIDIETVLAYDIDDRKVGKDLSEAIFELPNCTKKFSDVPFMNVKVKMGKILDGFSQHLLNYDEKYRIVLSSEKEHSKEDIIGDLKRSKTDILLNYLPVGSKESTRFYAECALDAGVSFINNIPEFIASDPIWAEKFRQKNIPIIGDDVKSQIGATIIHRTLANLFKNRGVKLEKTYQCNIGGNLDFLNMLDRQRLKSKKISKTEAVQTVLSKRIEDENIYIGPSDHIPFLKDNKIAFIRMEGKLFGDIPMNIELRLSVEDSPNSAGVVIDAIRCCKLALDRKIGGVLYSPSAYFMKHPAIQYNDDDAYQMVEDFINGIRKD